MYGVKSLLYTDKCGFEERVTCLYAGSQRGRKIDGERQGKRGKKENLIAARREGSKDLIAPMLFIGSLDAEGFEEWFRLFLSANVTTPSVFILDNASIHRKTKIKKLAKEAGHQVLLSPKYSPDLNDIEHDFSALKRARMYAKPGTSLDDIIRDYCAS